MSDLFFEGMAVEITGKGGQTHFAPVGCVGVIKQPCYGEKYSIVEFSSNVKKDQEGIQKKPWTQYIIAKNMQPTARRPD